MSGALEFDVIRPWLAALLRLARERADILRLRRCACAAPSSSLLAVVTGVPLRSSQLQLFEQQCVS